jgi:hypothetical protein
MCKYARDCVLVDTWRASLEHVPKRGVRVAVLDAATMNSGGPQARGLEPIALAGRHGFR